MAVVVETIAINPILSKTSFYKQNDSILADNPNMRVLFHFFCRYTDELQTYSIAEQKQKMEIDDVQIVQGNLSALTFINDSTSLQMETKDKRHWIRLSNAEKSFFELSAPCSFELIMGKNKKKLEDDFLQEIGKSLHPFCLKEKAIPFWVDSLHTFGVQDGNFYFIPEITSNLYYKKEIEKATLICNPDYPEESVYNLFLSPDTPGDFQLRLSVCKYGFKKEEFTLPLKQWLLFCKNSGCELFVGVEEIHHGIIQATQFVVNKTLQYNHVLTVTFSQNLLKERKGVIEGSIHVYIPIHNLENLFETYKGKNKLYNVNVKKK